LGYKARCLWLKRQDVEVRESEAGHVATEVYLPESKQWAFLDPQFDIMPIFQGNALNAVELQGIIAQREPGLGLYSGSKIPAQAYLQWIAPYLFYIDVKLDNRVGIPNISSQGLMLVPIGATKPKIMQRHWLIEEMIYTHSRRAFYAAPV